MMARMIAARLKGGTGGAGTGAANGNGQPPNGAGGGQRASSGQQAGGQANGQWQGAGQGRAGGAGTGDMQQLLSRAPAIKISDLQKGEAVMLVSTQGTSDVKAITLLAGVEPLLEAPAASQSLLSNWSMGSGAAEAATAQ